MSLFWLIVSLGFGSVSLFIAIKGAVQSKEGWLGRMAFLSIPIFFASVVGAFSLPHKPGISACEIFALLGVISSALLVYITNHYHNKVIMEKVNKRLNQ